MQKKLQDEAKITILESLCKEEQRSLAACYETWKNNQKTNEGRRPIGKSLGEFCLGSFGVLLSSMSDSLHVCTRCFNDLCIPGSIHEGSQL